VLVFRQSVQKVILIQMMRANLENKLQKQMLRQSTNKNREDTVMQSRRRNTAASDAVEYLAKLEQRRQSNLIGAYELPL
jgi:hypothetical protein